MKITRRVPRFVKMTLPTFLVIAVLMTVSLLHSGPTNALAGAEIVGNPNGSTVRALVGKNDGSVQRVVYVSQAAYTMADTTPVASQAQCFPGYTLHKAQVVLSGTMSGTAPTLAVLWQNSLDGGVTWNNVGTWTTINATVTPASQSQTVADIYNASTAVSYGDCWRATYQFGGTGTVVANIGIVGYEK
jgi:hypothetical protein